MADDSKSIYEFMYNIEAVDELGAKANYTISCIATTEIEARKQLENWVEGRVVFKKWQESSTSEPRQLANTDPASLKYRHRGPHAYIT